MKGSPCWMYEWIADARAPPFLSENRKNIYIVKNTNIIIENTDNQKRIAT